MPVITNIEDLRVLAQKRVPRMFYDYADSGSWTEGTYRANESDFQKIKLRQRVAVNMENRSTATQMVGVPTKMPVAIAPVGLTGMQSADGEIKAARAAEKFGIPFILSTMSICSIEDIAEHTSAPFMFQLYMMRDREAMANMIERVRQAGCSALVLTLDLQVIGQRHKDLKNGLTAPPRPTLANILNLMTKPRWCLGMAGTRRHTFGNLVGHVKGVSDMNSLSAWTNEQFDPRLSWADVAWVKQQWGGKLILKGIQDVEDAKLAVQSGADLLERIGAAGASPSLAGRLDGRQQEADETADDGDHDEQFDKRETAPGPQAEPLSTNTLPMASIHGGASRCAPNYPSRDY